MTLADERPVIHSVRVSPSLLVAVTPQGLRLAAIPEHRRHDLTHGDLELLNELRRGPAVDIDELLDAISSRTGTPLGTLQATVAYLRAIHRLREHPDAAEPEWIDVERDRSGLPPYAPSSPPTAVGDHLVLSTPVQVLLTDGGYTFVDHDGVAVAELTSRELVAVAELCAPLTIDAAIANQHRTLGDHALGHDEFRRVVAPLIDAGVVVRTTVEEHRSSTAQGRSQLIGVQEMRRLRQLMAASERGATVRAEARRAAQSSGTTTTKPFVVPYYKARDFAPLALGMILAYAQQYDGGRLCDLYAFEPNWVARKPTIRGLLAEAPAVVLFSSYVWSHGDNLAISSMVKTASPDSVTIHGGPDVPSRSVADAAYLRDHPHIDIIVRGEGEHTTAEILEALEGHLTARDGLLPDLRHVRGITYRSGEEIIRTDDRDRIADLDALPSPYLTGLFDAFGDGGLIGFSIETNRGCPYGCTFCDWGSATKSRIRKFSLERVFAELEWAAKNKMPRAFIADANFGILPRDLEIAEEIARLKGIYGYPMDFGTNYAKNTTTHLRAIVQTLADAGVITDGLVSLQTVDPGTLAVIQRSNIKVDEYTKLAHAFREANMPFFVDLMMGLPGATPASFRNDLQHVIDSEVGAKIYRTELLVNSPMNDPDYVERYQIETETKTGQNIRVGRPLLVSTSSYTRADYEEMHALRTTFLVGENYTALRYVSRFVRQETGVIESEFYARLDHLLRTHRDQYPILAWATETLPDLLVAPASWSLYYDDVQRILADHFDLADSSALQALLRAQRALMPARLRTFPERVPLDHDFAAWFSQVREAKDVGHDWCTTVPRLHTFGPTVFEVDDPTDVCTIGIGFRIDSDMYGGWELHSTIARPSSKRHLLLE